MSDGEQAESRDAFEQAESSCPDCGGPIYPDGAVHAASCKRWADSRAEPYAEHRLLWDTVAALLGESRAKGGTPVIEAVRIAGQDFTITVEAHMPPEQGGTG